MATIAQSYIEEGIEKGLEQGIEQGVEMGRVTAVQNNILDLLQLRFGLTTAETEIETAVQQIADPDKLQTLFRIAATADEPAEFTAVLETVTADDA